MLLSLSLILFYNILVTIVIINSTLILSLSLLLLLWLLLLLLGIGILLLSDHYIESLTGNYVNFVLFAYSSCARSPRLLYSRIDSLSVHAYIYLSFARLFGSWKSIQTEGWENNYANHSTSKSKSTNFRTPLPHHYHHTPTPKKKRKKKGVCSFSVFLIKFPEFLFLTFFVPGKFSGKRDECGGVGDIQKK